MNPQPDFASPKLFLIIAPPEMAKGLLADIIAKFAQAEPVMVLDGGNSFNSYRIAHLVRLRGLGHKLALANIQVARAFSCQQMLALLEKTPTDGSPKVILNFLSTFSDDGLDVAERSHIFTQCLDRMRSLSRSAQVFISVCPPNADQVLEREWFARLQATAGNILFLKGQPIQPLPEGLF